MPSPADFFLSRSFPLSSDVQAWLCSDSTGPSDRPSPRLWLSSMTSEAAVILLPDGQYSRPDVPGHKLEKTPLALGEHANTTLKT